MANFKLLTYLNFHRHIILKINRKLKFFIIEEMDKRHSFYIIEDESCNLTDQD